jgi:ppGpp synthetase/RelA/SpoT-type nucleotidyltranferase
VHISLKVGDKKLEELQCDVQIKTAVQDAFSWKTHALAYKPGEDTDPWFIEQFIRISVLLRTADGISDQLRGRLEEGRSVSVKKRKAVRANCCWFSGSITRK